MATNNATKTEAKDVEMVDVVGAIQEVDFKKYISLLEKSAATSEPRLGGRALRSIPSLRKKLNANLLRKLLGQTLVAEEDKTIKNTLLSYLQSFESSNEAPAQEQQTKKPKAVIPEVESFLHLLVTVFLIDQKKNDLAITSATLLVDRAFSHATRRTMNPLTAKAFFYYSLSYEVSHKLSEIRPKLITSYRTACLRHNSDAQATLVNLILRNYLEYNLYGQAEKFASNANVKEESLPVNELARYLYYQGRIKSMQLDYSEAFRNLLGASRRAPQEGATGIGFRKEVQKWAILVQLLLGEIPDKQTFVAAHMKNSLKPYYQLTAAVRIGDLKDFHTVLSTFADSFKKDRTYSLVVRLRQNVIKAGLRKINLAYSKISLKDICAKLHLDNVEDAEFVVAKAIKDGVIHATIDHAGQFLKSTDSSDVYSTQEPQLAFNRRIDFCLKTHNEAVKAMRFPPHQNKFQLDNAEERREREQEIADNLAEDDDDFM